MKKDKIKNVALTNKELLYFYLLIHIIRIFDRIIINVEYGIKVLQDYGTDDNAWIRETGRNRSLEFT
jgi:hypothetical protein